MKREKKYRQFCRLWKVQSKNELKQEQKRKQQCFVHLELVDMKIEKMRKENILMFVLVNLSEEMTMTMTKNK